MIFINKTFLKNCKQCTFTTITGSSRNPNAEQEPNPATQMNTMRLCTSVETGLKTGYNNLNECDAARISVEID
jgi:hypothetical protein